MKRKVKTFISIMLVMLCMSITVFADENVFAPNTAPVAPVAPISENIGLAPEESIIFQPDANVIEVIDTITQEVYIPYGSAWQYSPKLTTYKMIQYQTTYSYWIDSYYTIDRREGADQWRTYYDVYHYTTM